MTKTQIPTGKVCEDCENLDKNLDEVTGDYPLATQVVDNYGYLANEFICSECYDARIDQYIG